MCPATEQIESQWILSGQAPWPLSVQQAVSCTEDMYGCGGGDTIAVFEQLLTGETKSSQPVPGLVSAAMVPYTQSSTCPLINFEPTLDVMKSGMLAACLARPQCTRSAWAGPAPCPAAPPPSGT